MQITIEDLETVASHVGYLFGDQANNSLERWRMVNNTDKNAEQNSHLGAFVSDVDREKDHDLLHAWKAWLNSNSLSNLPICHFRANLQNLARRFVAENWWWLGRVRSPYMSIGAANASRDDFDKNIVVLQFWHIAMLHFQFFGGNPYHGPVVVKIKKTDGKRFFNSRARR